MLFLILMSLMVQCMFETSQRRGHQSIFPPHHPTNAPTTPGIIYWQLSSLVTLQQLKQQIKALETMEFKKDTWKCPFVVFLKFYLMFCDSGLSALTCFSRASVSPMHFFAATILDSFPC